MEVEDGYSFKVQAVDADIMLHLFQLQKSANHKTPNLQLYMLSYSLTQGLFFVILDRFRHLCPNIYRSKLVFVVAILVSKLPIVLCHLVGKLRRRGRGRQQHQQEGRPVLEIKCLVIPGLFRIFKYAIALMVVEGSRTYYFAIGFVLNLVVGEVISKAILKASSDQPQPHLKSRITGLIFLSAGALAGVTDPSFSININLYLILLATCIFMVQGDAYLSSKTLKLYRPDYSEMISKDLLVQLCVLLCLYPLMTVMQDLEIINQPININELLSCVKADSGMLWVSVMWVMSFGALGHIVSYSLKTHTSTSQHLYCMSSALIWHQLNLVIRDFQLSLLLSVFLGMLSVLFYMRLFRLRNLYGLVSFFTRRDPMQISLH